MIRLLFIYFILLKCNLFCQTYSGKSINKVYSSSLKINKDSTVLFNYNSNCCFSDFQGTIKKIQDSIYELNCGSVFSQCCMMNFWNPDLTIDIDTVNYKKVSVKYPSGFDTVYYFKERNFDSGNVIGYQFKHLTKFDSKNKKQCIFYVDIGYKDLFNKKPVIFKASKNTMLFFPGPEKLIFQVVIKKNTIRTMGDHISQTGEMLLFRNNK